jgi:protocatechuate 3,4-dioxygenase beta subunit
MKNSRRKFLQIGLASPLIVAYAGAGELTPTPPETEGPFYPTVAQKDKDFDLTQIKGNSLKASGEVVKIKGRVVDQEGTAIADAIVDIWQANSFGRYRHPADRSDEQIDHNFQGWAIVPSGKDGTFNFKTIKPGAYKVGANWSRPPHIHFKVGKRGFEEVTTQMYFPNEPLNDVDLLLQKHSEQERKVMIAASTLGSAGTPTFEYQVVLRRV